jgi:hypothetical protein
VNQKNGSVHPHHTWHNSAGHQIGAYAGKTEWSSKTSPASGHVWTGIGTIALDKHLTLKARRYKNESTKIANVPILESLAEGAAAVQGYANWIAANSPSLLSVPITQSTPASELREVWKMKAHQAKLFGDGLPLTDWDVRGEKK